MAKVPLNIEIGKRILKVRATLGYAQKDLAEKLGVPYHRIRDYENGSAGISTELLQLLSSLGISLNWLITGEGNMLANNAIIQDSFDENTVATIPVVNVPRAKQTIPDNLREIESDIKSVLLKIQSMLP